MNVFKQIVLISLALMLSLEIGAQSTIIERVKLHTDRTLYVAGETVFYKLHLIDKLTNKVANVNKVGYLLLRDSNSLPTIRFKVKINRGVAIGSINLPDTLKSGSYQFVSFTSNMKNEGESCFEYKNIAIINSFDKKYEFAIPKFEEIDTTLKSNSGITIRVDKKKFRIREKIALNISSEIKASASVSVYEIPQATYCVAPTTKTLHHCTISEKNKSINTSYLSETKGKILRGYVIDSTTQIQIKNAIVLLSCIDTIPNLQYAVTDSSGLFQLQLTDYYNSKKLFLTIKDASEYTQWKIVIEDEFSLLNKWSHGLIENANIQKYFLQKCQNIAYINKIYSPKIADNQHNNLYNENSTCPVFYNCNASVTIPGEYEALSDFFEIAVELLPGLRVVKQNKKYQIQLFNSSIRQFETLNPAIFLDGVFVDNLNKILVLGSEQIMKIEILSEKRAFGDLIFGGMVSITTKTPEIVNNKIASHSLKIHNDNYNFGNAFKAIIPNSKTDKNVPFVKQLLYWNPNVTLSENCDTVLDFYSSDNVGTYIIRVAGIENDGSVIDKSISIEVINN